MAAMKPPVDSNATIGATSPRQTVVRQIMTSTSPPPPPTQPQHSQHHHNTFEQLKYAFAGGLSAAITRSLCQPFDVLKIRFQLQVEPLESSGPGSKYHSIPQALRLIYREEGLTAFWKGHNPAQVLSIVYGFTQFWTYEELNNEMRNTEVFHSHPVVRTFMAGAVAGSLSTCLITPIDVIRTRLIAQDNTNGYKHSFQGLRVILRNDGVRGLYRGLMPAIIQIAPLTGSNFTFYESFCRLFQQALDVDDRTELPSYVLLVCGGLAGLSSKTLVYPLDLVKKRMQIQGFSKHRRTFGQHFECNGMIHCLRQTIRHEGLRGIYKGFVPSILKAAFTTSFQFSIYEQIKRVLF